MSGPATAIAQDDPGKAEPARGWLDSILFPGLVWLSIVLYVAFFSWLSIARHETFQSNAMDLGYTDQVVWNTLHGRFMQFSTLEGAHIDLPLDQFRRTDTLLAYHVELILAPISLLYLVYDSPVTLLLLQTVVLGLGALPASWLARDHLGSRFAGLCFALAYLLAPAIQGANLSDFHGVSMAASLLLFAFWFLRGRRYVPFFAVILLAMSAKEDVPLLVTMMGLYILLVLRERRAGALTVGLGLVWFLVATQVILPYHNGLPISPFFHRLAVFGPRVKDSVLNVLRDPLLVWRWLARPQIATYLRGILASAGFMSLLAPVILALSAPVLAMNVFSTWDWTYSEGAHYSATIVPFVIVSGIYGLGFLARLLSERGRVPRVWAVNGLAALVLLISSYHHYRVGISPLARSYHPPHITAHHRLAQELMALIPPDAALSTQSGLYPHLAHREKAYFYPAINDAEYVFLDVAGSTYPISTAEVHRSVQRLLSSGEYGVLAARDGYVLLKRGLTQGADGLLDDEFYTFARASERAVPQPAQARFGDEIELLGYDYTVFSVVHVQQLPVTVTTYWRLLRPQAADLEFAFFFTREDGAIVYHYEEPTPTATWYPVHRWQQGEVIRMDTPILSVGRLEATMVAVVQPRGDPWSTADRLQPIESLDGQPLEVVDEGTLLKLFRFP